MKKIRIDYNSNPDAPKEVNHIGFRSKLTSQDYREFSSLHKAIDFYMECTAPIPKLKDIAPNKEWVKEFNELSVKKNVLEAEEFYWENREEILEEI